MQTQKYLVAILTQEAKAAAARLISAEFLGDLEDAREWASYFDAVSGYAVAIKNMTREEFTSFLAWNRWAYDLLFA